MEQMRGKGSSPGGRNFVGFGGGGGGYAPTSYQSSQNAIRFAADVGKAFAGPRSSHRATGPYSTRGKLEAADKRAGKRALKGMWKALAALEDIDLGKFEDEGGETWATPETWQTPGSWVRCTDNAACQTPPAPADATSWKKVFQAGLVCTGCGHSCAGYGVAAGTPFPIGNVQTSAAQITIIRTGKPGDRVKDFFCHPAVPGAPLVAGPYRRALPQPSWPVPTKTPQPSPAILPKPAPLPRTGKPVPYKPPYVVPATDIDVRPGPKTRTSPRGEPPIITKRPAEHYRVPDGTKKKQISEWLARLLRLYHGATELTDGLDCLFKALPETNKYTYSPGTTGGSSNTHLYRAARVTAIDKIAAVYNNLEKVDLAKAAACIAYDQLVEDKLVGKFMGKLGKNFEAVGGPRTTQITQFGRQMRSWQ